MPYARRNLKKKGPKVSLKPKNRGHFRSKFVGDAAIKKVWDNYKTINQNFAALGLAIDVNKISTTESENKEPGLVQFIPQEEVKTEYTDVSVADQIYCRKLIEKHGDNYEAMFRDTKVNSRQLTVNQLQKLLERYHKFLALYNEEAPKKEENKDDDDASLLEFSVCFNKQY